MRYLVGLGHVCERGSRVQHGRCIVYDNVHPTKEAVGPGEQGVNPFRRRDVGNDGPDLGPGVVFCHLLLGGLDSHIPTTDQHRITEGEEFLGEGTAQATGPPCRGTQPPRRAVETSVILIPVILIPLKESAHL